MITIRRQPELLQSQRFDLVVIGGGIYGACVLLEASRRGWKTLLLERDDFGGATSFSSLRILHGGLRYLQNLDLKRFHRSVREQTWWLTHFPDLVEPLPCLMPLYNCGLQRTCVLRGALQINDMLASAIRRGTPAQAQMEPSRVLTPSETVQRFPSVNQKGLRGGALWQDVVMKSPQRLLIELLRWAIAAGGQSLNYAPCTGFEISEGRIRSVLARCGVGGETYAFETQYVVNCAGPWLGEVSALANPVGDVTSCQQHAFAFNLMIDRPSPSGCAVAVSAEPGKTQSLFVVPMGNRTLAGTRHLPPQSRAEPSKAQIDTFLAELNQAVPGWKLSVRDIDQVLAGRLPPQAKGSHIPKKSPRIRHLADTQGVLNLTSVEGPKYTTARHNAQVAVREIADRRGMKLNDYQPIKRPSTVERPAYAEMANISCVAQDLRDWIAQESIVRPEDFARRHDFTKNALQQLSGTLAQLQGWPE